MLRRLFRKDTGDAYIRIVAHLEVLISSSEDPAIPGYLREMQTPDIVMAIKKLDRDLLRQNLAMSGHPATEASQFGLAVDTKARAALALELKLRGEAYEQAASAVAANDGSRCEKCGSPIDHFGFQLADVIALESADKEAATRLAHAVGGKCESCGRVSCASCYQDNQPVRYSCPNCGSKIAQFQ